MRIILDFCFTIAGGVKPYFIEMMENISDIDKINHYTIIVTDNGYELIRNIKFSKNLVYRGVKVMPYSTGCTTPLSNFEANSNYKNH